MTDRTFKRLVLAQSVLLALVLLKVWFQPVPVQAVSLPKLSMTITGVGAAAACPAGWTEEVTDTATGNAFSPLTSITTTSIAPVTAITTTSIAPVTSITQSPQAISYKSAGGTHNGLNSYNSTNVSPDTSETGTFNIATGGSATSYTVANGGSTTSYTVANGGSTTSYTLHYRVCSK